MPKLNLYKECPRCTWPIDDEIEKWWRGVVERNPGRLPKSFHGLAFNLVCEQCDALLEVEAEVYVHFYSKIVEEEDDN